MINSQLTCLRLYKHFNHNQAMRLNTGNEIEFFKRLIELEKKLSDSHIKTLDAILFKRYNIQELLINGN